MWKNLVLPPPQLLIGERDWTVSFMLEEIIWLDLLLIFPMALVTGFVTQRLASRAILPYVFGSGSWNTMIRMVVTHLVTKSLLSSVNCLHARDEEHDESTLAWWTTNLGFDCPAKEELKADLLPTHSTLMVTLLVRFMFVCVGVYLGELFTPIAVTGNIACGKSTIVSRLLRGQFPREEGDPEVDGEEEEELIDFSEEIEVIDVDKIAHEVLLPKRYGSVYQDVLKAFGPSILGQEKDPESDIIMIDRTKLGEVIFDDAEKRRRLNNMTHPRIASLMLQKMIYHSYIGSLFSLNPKIVVVDIPLLFESGPILCLLFSLVCVAGTTPEIQKQRLKTRNPDWSEEHCEQRIKSQMPLARKTKQADVVLWNDCKLEDFYDKVDKFREDCSDRILGTLPLRLYHLILLMGVSVLLAIYFKKHTELLQTLRDTFKFS